jgi:hypothetical protein
MSGTPLEPLFGGEEQTRKTPSLSDSCRLVAEADE